MSNIFGAHIKALRQKKGLTLRDFCLQHGFDPGNHSKMERGLFPPPVSEAILEHFADALDLAFGSPERQELFDLAAAGRGQLPRDLTDDEVLAKLPVLFQGLRAGSSIDDLVASVRSS